MLTNKRDAARRRILTVLPRMTLQDLSLHERPWTLTRPALLTMCVERWNEDEVRAAVDRVITRASVVDQRATPRKTQDRPALSSARACQGRRRRGRNEIDRG
jgi:hypothetical protein